MPPSAPQHSARHVRCVRARHKVRRLAVDCRSSSEEEAFPSRLSRRLRGAAGHHRRRTERRDDGLCGGGRGHQGRPARGRRHWAGRQRPRPGHPGGRGDASFLDMQASAGRRVARAQFDQHAACGARSGATVRRLNIKGEFETARRDSARAAGRFRRSACGRMWMRAAKPTWRPTWLKPAAVDQGGSASRPRRRPPGVVGGVQSVPARAGIRRRGPGARGAPLRANRGHEGHLRSREGHRRHPEWPHHHADTSCTARASRRASSPPSSDISAGRRGRWC